MKPLFILFVSLHLLIDLAMPSLPGAFRFNLDESVVGVRVQPVQVQDVKPAAPDLLPEALELRRVEIKIPVDPQRRIDTPDLILSLPRRDPSSDRSAPRLTEDH